MPLEIKLIVAVFSGLISLQCENEGLEGARLVGDKTSTEIEEGRHLRKSEKTEGIRF